MAFTPEEMKAAQRMVESGMTGGELAPGLDSGKVERSATVPIPLNRMLAEPETVAIGGLKLLLRPLPQREMRRQFMPMAQRLPFFDAAIYTDGPGIDFTALAQVAAQQAQGEFTVAMLARQWALMQQDEGIVWLFSELVALQLVDDGIGPVWPRPDPGTEPAEDAPAAERSTWLEHLEAPAPEGRRWLDDALDELSIGEWCDLLRVMIEVNAGYIRTADSFALPAPEG